MGRAQPAAAFFEHVIAECGVAPSEIAYIGDQVDNDLAPALAAGMVAVHIRRVHGVTSRSRPPAQSRLPASTNCRRARLEDGLPLVDQALDVAALRRGELEARDDPAGLRDVGVLDRRFEALAKRLLLAELPAKPALEAHLLDPGQNESSQISSVLTVAKPSRS
jgi:hypothetical protein